MLRKRRAGKTSWIMLRMTRKRMITTTMITILKTKRRKRRL